MNKCEKFLRLQQVYKMFGLAKSIIWHWVQEGLPPPAHIGRRGIGWPEGEIAMFQNAIIAGRGQDARRALVRQLLEGGQTCG